MIVKLLDKNDAFNKKYVPFKLGFFIIFIKNFTVLCLALFIALSSAAFLAGVAVLICYFLIQLTIHLHSLFPIIGQGSFFVLTIIFLLINYIVYTFTRDTVKEERKFDKEEI